MATDRDTLFNVADGVDPFNACGQQRGSMGQRVMRTLMLKS
jgi:hypothetical protein